MNSAISRRSYHLATTASSWEEIWEAGPYYDRVSELIEDARSYVILVGWQIDSRLRMKRPSRPERAAGPHLREALQPETLKNKVIRLCQSKPDLHIYFLVWDHAYIYVIERETWQGRIWDNLHPRVHFVFDNRHPLGASHHEKICIVDGKIALCGGIDLCDQRWDTPHHFFRDPRRSLDGRSEQHGPYHDLAVSVTGPVCKEIENHVIRRWRTLSGIPCPPAPAGPRSPLHVEPKHPESGHLVYVSRTIADLPRSPPIAPIRAQKRAQRPDHLIVREIEFLLRDLIFAARNLIVLEGQYYWSREVNDLLITKFQSLRNENRNEQFTVVLVLANLEDIRSFTRHMSRFQLKLLQQLQAAAATYGVRLIMGSPYVHAPSESPGKPKPVYVHSKVVIVDDRYLSIGTANFATRALRLDTEINLTLEARTEQEHAHIRAVTRSILKHWGLEAVLERDNGELQAAASVGAGEVFLRPFKPWLDEQQLGTRSRRRRSLQLMSHLAWEYLFDPTLPWLPSLRSELWRNWRKAMPFALVAATVALSAVLLQCFSSARLGYPLQGWPMVYSALISLAWIIPVPISWLGILATFQMGPAAATASCISGLWAASGFAHFFSRLLPGPAARYTDLNGFSERIGQNLGKRDFVSYLRGLADPRFSYHVKISSQMLYWVPFPWIAFANWILLPGIVYWAVRLLSALTPPGLKSVALEHPAGLLALIFVFSFGKLLVKRCLSPT